MTQLITWLSSHASGLGILGAAVAFIWSTTQQVAQRKRESREHEFHAFHKLVKDLVSPETADGVIRLDRQAAVVFELRHSPATTNLATVCWQASERHGPRPPISI